MNQQQASLDDQYDIIIVECCENCDSHQAHARHSEWKYYEQFNQLKRKIQRFVNNTIVIKNPIPDELVKNDKLKMNNNAYINKDTGQEVTFPRIGAFEVYIYNVLIYSKLLTNNWPNHYKLIQIITKVIEEKKKGNSLDQFSVYRGYQLPESPEKVQKEKVQKFSKNLGPAKKKKKDYRVYKSKDKSIHEPSANKKLDPLTTNKKAGRRTLLDKDRQRDHYETVNPRNLQTKAENRIKLPSLRNTINFRQEQEGEREQQKGVNKRYSQKQIGSDENKSLKRIFNSIQQFEKDEISFISNKQSLEENKFNSLVLDQNQSIDYNKSIKDDKELKFYENRSVQFSEREEGKDFMNRSIQYEPDEDNYCDFGLQIDDGTMPKQINLQFVQTEPVNFLQQPLEEQKKPYMLDQEVEANIVIPIPQETEATQTFQPQYLNIETNTQTKVTINRTQQFPEPEQIKKPLGEFSYIDESFRHLYEKRRNIVDGGQEFYSIDKFQEVATKYKWVGRAKLKESVDQIRRKMLLQALVFSVYDFFGIKAPEKRLSFQTCTNMLISQKDRKNHENALIHILTPFDPEIQYLFQFQQYSHEQKKYPLSEQLVFRNSRQKIKFQNYSLLLAIAYFLGDKQIFQPNKNNIGVVVSNQEVKQIYKLNADQFIIPNEINQSEYRAIIVNNQEENHSISIKRLSQFLQVQFVSVINKIVNRQSFEQLIKVIEENFIKMSPSHKKFRNTILSLKTQKIDEELVKEFIEMLKLRRKYLIEEYKGEIYAYQNYGVLQPQIKFDLENFSKKEQVDLEAGFRNRQPENNKIEIERKLMFNDKHVSPSDIQKHLRNKDNLIMITGQSGIGKTSFMRSICSKIQQSYSQKIRITRLPRNIFQSSEDMKLKKTIDGILDDYKKQIICIEDIELYFMQIISLINKLYNKEDPRTKPDMSFFITGNDKKGQSHKFKTRLLSLGIKVIKCDLLPFQVQEIRDYLMKEIKYHNVTDKRNLIEEVIGNQNIQFNESHPRYNNIMFLRVPFFTALYAEYLGNVEDLNDFRNCLVLSLNRYSLLKQIHHLSKVRHYSQTKRMNIKINQLDQILKRIAFEYYHNNYQVNGIIKELYEKVLDENQIISCQLAFYPLNLQAMVNGDRFLFLHLEFLHYYLCEAYVYFIENSFRNLRMEKVYSNENLMILLKHHYIEERTHSRLLDVVENSKKFKNTSEQASVAITLLNKLGYIFSNINLDEIEIPDADLSKSIFYHTSLRGANLYHTILYKSQMLSCQLEGTVMDSISMHVRKYEIQYTVLSASLSTDGRHLALGCGNFLIILNTQTGKEIKRIQAHLDIIRTVRYSRDNMGLVTIADDKTLRVWDTRNYKSVVFRLPQKGLIIFNYQTENIAVVSKSNVKLWNIKSMASQIILQGHSDFVTSVQFGGNGKYVITGSRDTTVRLWDTNSGELLKVYKGHSSQIITGKLSPNKKIVASSSKDKDLIFWETDGKSEILRRKFEDEVIEFCMDDKQKYIIITFAKNHDIIVAKINDLEAVHYLQGHKARVISINFDIYYRRLISLGKDKTVRIWDLDKIMEIQQQQYQKTNNYKLKTNQNKILSIAFCKLSLQYAIGHQNGEISIYSAVDNRLVDQIISHNGAINCLAYDRSGKMYSAGSDGSVRIWNLKVRREPRVVDVHSSDVLKLKLNEKYRMIATSSAYNQLVVYDFTGIQLIMSTREEGRVQAIEFNKEQKIMAVGGTQKYVALFQIGEGGGNLSRIEELGPHDDEIVSMIFHEQFYLVVALKNGHVAIWNYIKATTVKKIENISPIISIVSFQKRYVCLVSHDGKIRIVNMDQGKQVKTFKYPENPTGVAINNSQTILYVTTKQCNILGWNLNSLKPKKDKINFGRVTLNQNGSKLVQVESGKQLLMRDLHEHDEEILKISNLESEIQGVSFYKEELVVMLRNGVHWDVQKNKQFRFDHDRESEGELCYIRSKRKSNFYRTAVRKVKGIKIPVQGVLEELFSA